MVVQFFGDKLHPGEDVKIIPIGWLQSKGKRFQYLRNGKNFEEQSPKTIMEIDKDKDLAEAEWTAKFGPYG